MTKLDVLMTEHAQMKLATDEWLGMGDKPGEDLNYLIGVIDMTERLLKELSDEDSNSGLTDEPQLEN